MAQYIMEEMPDIHKTGKRMTYPKFARIDNISTKELAERIHEISGFSVGDIEGVLRQTSIEMARLMSSGHSVKLDGIGTFTPSLALCEGKEREEVEGGTHRNAQSIFVGSVNFRVDKKMIREINSRCRLERGSAKQRRSSEKYTPEQRLKLALKYLEDHSFLTVREYRRITGLLQTTATKELKEWAAQPDSGIGIAGMAAHRVYIKKTTLSED